MLYLVMYLHTTISEGKTAMEKDLVKYSHTIITEVKTAMEKDIIISKRPVTIPDILKVVIDIIEESGHYDKEYLIKSLESHEESRVSNNGYHNEINTMNWKEIQSLKEELDALHKVLASVSIRKQKEIDMLESSLEEASMCCNEEEGE